MSKTRYEKRVGVFVLVGLILLAALMLQFSKGLTFFRPTYDIYLKAPNVGGLKENAAVLMSGLEVGKVAKMQLDPEGRSVTVTLRIFKNYIIRKDARFIIDQSGFLGDQYVGIVPTENKLEPFQDQDRAEAEAPFNFQEFTRTASGFISRVDETVKKLNEALGEVTKILLNPQTLTNLSLTAGHMRTFSERALVTIDEINALVATNGPWLGHSASNLVLFSEQLNQFASELRGMVSSNTNDITEIVKNIESSSESLKALMSDLQAGKGPAGNLLKNEEMAGKISNIANNLSITTSNLNRLGLWRMLWQQKPRKSEDQTGETSEPLRSPKAGR